MTAQLRSDALAIWQAAIDAVRSDRLVTNAVRVEGDWLLFDGSSSQHSADCRVHLPSIHRIAVVGAGKAGAGMAAGLETALGPKLIAEKHLRGWLNVPADCVRELQAIHLHAARPAGINEPTPEGVTGAQQILKIVSELQPSDLCICLLSGGGSALLPAPIEGVSLAEKQALTRELSAAGANIAELNTVRKQLSRLKGGGLARACRAGQLITLIISDVLGDPLDVIASGPTVPNTTTAADALAILDRYSALTPALKTILNTQTTHHSPLTTHSQSTNLLIGNNALAVTAAGEEAQRRGYSPRLIPAQTLEGPAEDVGREHVQALLKMQSASGPNCLITGGEPTVKLAPPEIRGKGGRNQQLVLAALAELMLKNPQSAIGNPQSAIPFCLLSGGTDGEDGPTDAAGAFIDQQILALAEQRRLNPSDYLRRSDAYTFFQRVGALIKTGPTHTNVCDVRVVLTGPS
jgi:hydroxypyruvate reductase